MDDNFLTDEDKPKKNFKGIFVIILIIIIVLLAIYGIYSFINYRKALEEAKKKEEEVNLLNPELDGIKYFGIRDNYIVGIYDNLDSINIYNLMQGTGQFGDFKDYFYYDKNLYLIFDDNSIYKLSLTSGNRVYEITPFVSLNDKASFIGFASPSNILVSENNKIVLLQVTDKGFKRSELAIYPNSINKTYLSNKSLYILVNNSLYKYDLVNNTNTKLYDNVSNLQLFNDVLTYNISGVYYGYNTKSSVNAEIARDSKGVTINNNKIYSLKNDGIYLDSKKIYSVHYNNLDNLNSIGSYLEVYDTSTTDKSKKRIVYIDLNNKYKSTVGKDLYTNVKEYTK